MAEFMAMEAPNPSILLSDDILQIVASESNGKRREIMDHNVLPVCVGDSDEVHHYLLTIEAMLKNRESKQLRFFIKTMVMRDGTTDLPECSSTERRVDFLPQPLAEELFREDVHYYSNLQEILKRNYFGFPWSPTCHYSSARMIILQEMKAKGFKTNRVPRNYAKTLRAGSCFALEKRYLHAALTTLASLHAASILAGKPVNEGFPYALREKVFKAGSALHSGFQVIERMAERYGLNSRLCNEIFTRICDLVQPKKGDYNVVCHGAPFGANLLFDTRPWCQLIDYGYARYSSACLDVALLIYMHTTPLYRSESEIHLVNFYAHRLHEVLIQSTVLMEVRVDPLPTPESIVDKYRGYRLAGMARACYEWLIQPLIEHGASDDFKSYLKACKSRLAADSDADDMAKDMLVELFEEAERTV